MRKPPKSELEFVTSYSAARGHDRKLYKDARGTYFLDAGTGDGPRPLTKVAAISDWLKYAAPEDGWAQLLVDLLRSKEAWKLRELEKLISAPGTLARN
jgi:hypothetical protein